MHYDVESGAKDTRGFFSKFTVVALFVSLILIGFYMLINWFAPNIFFIISDNRTAIENVVKNQPIQGDMLRIPLLEIEREIVSKKSDGRIQISENNNSIILSGSYHSLGITPFDTKNLSPLALLGRAQKDMRIYIDLDGIRMAYQVKDILENTKPNPNSTEELVIYALDGLGKIATVEVRAVKVGEVKL
jgi:hypothetical protein